MESWDLMQSDWKAPVRLAEYKGRPTAFVSLTGKHGSGKEAILSPRDVDHMMFFSDGMPWTFSGGNSDDLTVGHYVKKEVRDPDGNRVFTTLHDWIMQPPKGMRVDHINSNTLDNRRSNLRITDASGNSANRRTYAKSGYKGLQIRDNGSVRATLQTKGKRVFDETFPTLKEAKRALKKARKQHDVYVHKSKRRSSTPGIVYK